MTHINGFKLIGISVETTNQDGKAMVDLMQLWQRFQSENLLEVIPNSLSGDIYSVYTDYESDYTGKYTCFLGLAVSSLENIPNGMVGREFNAQTVTTFMAQGELPMAVADKWREIWDADKELNRSYVYDYEVYSDRARNGELSEVDIYIGVK